VGQRSKMLRQFDSNHRIYFDAPTWIIAAIYFAAAPWM
jgi:hypothetical protein